MGEEAFKRPRVAAVAFAGKEHFVVVSIVEYHEPSAVSLIAKPVIYKLEDISLWVLASGDFNLVSNVSVGLLKLGSICYIYLKHLGF